MTTGDRPSRRWVFARGGLAAATGVAVLASAEPPSLAQQAGGGDFAWGDALKRIKAAGKVVFAQSGSPIPPLYSLDPTTKKPVGYDVEIANLIAHTRVGFCFRACEHIPVGLVGDVLKQPNRRIDGANNAMTFGPVDVRERRVHHAPRSASR